jgi:hypothetical protein
MEIQSRESISIVVQQSMAIEKIHLNSTPSVSNLQNVEMKIEPNRPTVTVKNALFEFQVGQDIRNPL